MTSTISSDFVGLHVHSQHSFLDGYANNDQIASRAHVLGQSAVNISDHGEVGGHLNHARACEKYNIKALFGMEGYLVDSYEKAKAEKYGSNKISHVTLIAKTNRGLRNLWAWSSLAHTDKFYRKPLQDWAGAKELGADIFASDGCMLAFIARATLANDEQLAHEYMGRYLDVFGDNFFIELHTWQFEEAKTEEQAKLNADMTAINQAKVALAQQYGVPLVVVNDSHYASPGEWENAALVWDMNTYKNDDQTEGRGKKADHMMGDAELIYWMGRHGISESITLEAIKNTKAIADACEATIEPRERMPRITESDADDITLFIRHCESGFKRKVVERGLDVDRYWARLEYESKLIVEKNFAGYFNIVAEYTKAAKKKMLMGPARGSASGSLVAYLMDITEMDPLKYDLPFERFINPDRSGFPDIDLDFPQSKRPEVKQDLVDRFGRENVVQIGTLSTLGAKGMIRKMAKAFDIPWDDQTKMSAIFDTAKSNDPDKTSMTWDEIMEQLAEPLAPYIAKYPVLFEKMSEHVGMISNAATHASGILISNEPLLGDLPMRVVRDKSGKGHSVTSSFTMSEVEFLGFIKFDVLGIRHLDTIQVTLDLIKERHGKEIDLYSFGDDEFCDPAIWKPIHRGDTLGIFQLETADMTRVAKRFKPTSEVDVTDLISVNRPGVIYAKQLDPFLDRRDCLAAPKYDNPLTEQYLERTYGVIVFQEQIMKIVAGIAGFSPGESDSVRSAVAKKKQAQLDLFYDKFREGCLANPEFVEGSETGDPQGDVDRIWASIKASGSYAFSINHATAYAILSCWEVWLRHYYYHEFFTALMTTDPDKLPLYMRHVRARGLEVLPPHINESRSDFRPVDGAIRYGLAHLKGVSHKTVDPLDELRPFADFKDYLERSKVQRGAVFTLIKIGAFDCFGPRDEIFKRYVDWLINEKKPRTAKKDREKLAELEVPDFSSEQALYEIEKELTGSFITRDPMAPYLSMLEKTCTIFTAKDLDDLPTGKVAVIGGQLSKVKLHTTKPEKGSKKMWFLGLDYNDESFDVTVFPKDYAKYSFLKLEPDVPVAIRVIRLDKGCHATEIVRLDWIDKE